MPRQGVEWMGQRETVVSSAARTTSGESAVLEGYGPTSWLVVQVEVTAKAGTASPKLTVELQDTVDGTNFHKVTTLADFYDATGVQVYRVLETETPFTDRLRVAWTITGTTPSFTFSVQWVSE